MSNLLTNAGFESALGAEWSVTVFGAGAVARSTEQVREGGTYSLKLSTVGPGANTLLVSQAPAAATLGANTTYYCGCFVRANALGSVLTFSTLFDGIIQGLAIGLDPDLTGYDEFGNLPAIFVDPSDLTVRLKEFKISLLDTNFVALQFAYTRTVASTSAGIALVCQGSADSSWYVDDVWFSDDEAMPVPVTYPDNGKGPYRFHRSIVDPVSGIMGGEDCVMLDREGRYRLREFVDDLSHDEHLDVFTPRSEDEPPEP